MRLTRKSSSHAVALAQPFDVVDDGGGARLDAAVVAVESLRSAPIAELCCQGTFGLLGFAERIAISESLLSSPGSALAQTNEKAAKFAGCQWTPLDSDGGWQAEKIIYVSKLGDVLGRRWMSEECEMVRLQEPYM